MHAAIGLFSKFHNLFACIFTETPPSICYILIIYTNLILPFYSTSKGYTNPGSKIHRQSNKWP